MSENNLPLDANGVPFSKPAFWLPVAEYSKICSEINRIFAAQYRGKKLAAHASFGIDGKTYIYWFEIHGFDEQPPHARDFSHELGGFSLA